MGTVLTLIGLGVAATYATWWAGLFPGAVRRTAGATSPALIGAMPVFAAGFVAFGRASTWGPGPLVGFLLLATGIAVLAVLVHGALGFLVPEAARDAEVPATPEGSDPRPVLETFFAEGDAFAFGPSRGPGRKPPAGVETGGPGALQAS